MVFPWLIFLLVSVSGDKIHRRDLAEDQYQVGTPDSESPEKDLTTIEPESSILPDDSLGPLNMKADDSPIAPSADISTGTDAIDDIANFKEAAPRFSFAVWDTNNKICLLAFFKATFSITYPGQGGDQTVLVRQPETVTTKGRCAYQHQNPVLELSWSSLFRFTMTFGRLDDPKTGEKTDQWVVTSMTFNYNLDAPMFTAVTNGGPKTAHTDEKTAFFQTPESKSFFCPSPPLIDMYNSKRDKVVSVTLQDIQLQPFGIKKGKFSPVNRCSSIRIGGTMPDQPYDQDETVPIAVGSTLAVLSILTVVGYAIYKSFVLKRVDYNTME